MVKYFTVLICTTICISTYAQEKWDLRRMVDYAMKNNISVKQADVQARIAALQVRQAKFNQIPTVSFSSSAGMQFGRSIDPTSNQFTTTQLLYQNYQFQGGAELIGWGKLRNSVLAASFDADAALAEVERAANDVALNVASYYLQVLSAKEQIEIDSVQLAQTREQLAITRRKVEAGALPELSAAELEAQLATDSSVLIAARATYDQNILTLKGLLNLDMSLPFDVETPDVDQIPVEPLAELQPAYVFKLAKQNQPLQRANELRIKAGEKDILAYRAALYPSLSGFYSLGSTYNNQAFGLVGYNEVNVPIGKVNINGTEYPVLPPQPYQVGIFEKTKYFKQLDQNFSQSIGISLNVPIFNNGAARLAYENSKLNLRTLQLQKEEADLTLQSNIYTAYTTAIASLEKYNASTKNVEAAQKAYDYSLKRYELGLLPTLDLITNQGRLQTAKLQELANHYDYVFRLKVLEFYKGLGIKL